MELAADAGWPVHPRGPRIGPVGARSCATGVARLRKMNADRPVITHKISPKRIRIHKATEERGGRGGKFHDRDTEHTKGDALDIFVFNLRDLCASVVKSGSSVIFLRSLHGPLLLADHDSKQICPELLLFFEGKDSTHSLKCAFVLPTGPSVVLAVAKNNE